MMKPIDMEAAIIARLAREGWALDATGPATLTLRRLAYLGAKLSKRYEAACNYSWAGTTSYMDGTETLERQIVGEAELAGLFCYLQTDPRGAVVYVSPKPLYEQTYNQGVCLVAAD